jgi:hypothetical protein
MSHFYSHAAVAMLSAAFLSVCYMSLHRLSLRQRKRHKNGYLKVETRGGLNYKYFGSVINFRIDVTFEMRTVLYGIRLFIDNMKGSDRVFISNGDCREESRIAERQRECVCKMQRIEGKERWCPSQNEPLEEKHVAQ